MVAVLLILPLTFVKFYKTEKRGTENEKNIKVYDVKKDRLLNIELDEYITNVLAAEMPASFCEEALKAQAVCARTYALRKVNSGAKEHKGGDVCTDFAHCQAYYDNETMKEKWGKDYEFNLKKIKKCVAETSGEVITYNGEYAISVFHSCSNGKTENAKDVWGGDYPYLVSVDSVGDFDNKDYSSIFTIKKDEFVGKINSVIENKISSDDELKIGEFKMTEGDNVKSFMVGNSVVSGTDIRKLFSLKSTAFTIEPKGDEIIFSVYGNGHGVGMSQYGANGMANDGAKYDKILKYYYPGVELHKMYNKS